MCVRERELEEAQGGVDNSHDETLRLASHLDREGRDQEAEKQKLGESEMQ